MKYSLVTLLLLTGALRAQDRQVLALLNRIDLPNVSGRIDHFSADLKGGRIFIAAFGNRTVEVLEAQSGKHLHSIPDLAEPQGVYFDAATSRLFVACAKDGVAKVFDGGSFELLGTAKFSADADNIRYDARGHGVVVGYGVGTGGLGFLDSTGKKTSEIAFDGHPESFQIERTGSRVFVNVPDQKAIQVADLVQKTLLAKWPVTSATKNYPMALDEARQRLFVGCRTPPRMLVFDTGSGKQIASVPIVGDSDDLFFDPTLRRIYVIGGEGFLDVLEQKDADRYERLAHLPTAPGARTGLFVGDWGKLFVAVPRNGGQKAGILVYEIR